MIRRTLDAILSPAQAIAKECRRDGVDTPMLFAIDRLREIVLPVRKKRYWTVYKEDEENETILVDDKWSEYFSTDWEIKRECAKAFESRRKADVGDEFQIRAMLRHYWGSYPRNFDVKRLSRDTVAYKRFLISSRKEELIENRDMGLTPVLYSRF
jgi:hypothetical protein